MANIKFTNFARTALAVGVGSGDVTMSVTGGTGALFPALTAGQYFYAVLENAALDREIVKVTARATDTFTVTRGQDGTTARSWVAGDSVSLRFVAAAISDAVVGTLLAANNLSDVGSAATARANLGALTAGDNIGAATATTQSPGDNSTKVATTAFVMANTSAVALSSGTGYSSNTTLTDSAYGQFIYLWGTMTLTLPVATVDNIGKTISLHCYTTGAITIATQSGQSIYAQGGSIGTTYPIMSAGDSLTLVNYNGTSWMAVSGSGGIGYGQTRQNLNGSRSLSTTYYNTTGKPIIVEVASTTATITVTVGGVSTAGSPYTSTFIVPQGASYSVAATAGLVAWNETR